MTGRFAGAATTLVQHCLGQFPSLTAKGVGTSMSTIAAGRVLASPPPPVDIGTIGANKHFGGSQGRKATMAANLKHRALSARQRRGY